MLEVWNTFTLVIFDALLGWLRDLSPDVTVIVVALLSAVVLTLVRKWTTNQDLLARVARDRKRLRVMRREAKRGRDRVTVARLRMLLGVIGLKALRAEGRPMLVSIVPIAALATWCFLRLEYHTPNAGEDVEVRLETPMSMVGDVVHVVPQEGLESGAWVSEIVADTRDGDARGVATWTLRGSASDEPYRARVRIGRETIEQEIGIAPGPYGAPTGEFLDGRIVTHVQMREVDLWGVAPGIPWLLFPPWLVGYLVVVIPGVWAARRVLRVS
jgi:uncharacterized membrane protein (DUF106 family)